jgi:hypothetical protein
MVDLAHGVVFEILLGHLPINHFVNATTGSPTRPSSTRRVP